MWGVLKYCCFLLIMHLDDLVLVVPAMQTFSLQQVRQNLKSAICILLVCAVNEQTGAVSAALNKFFNKGSLTFSLACFLPFVIAFLMFLLSLCTQVTGLIDISLGVGVPTRCY